MKCNLIAISILLFSSSAFAAMSAADAKVQDAKREGDLSRIAIFNFKADDERTPAVCGGADSTDPVAPDYVATKLSSYSSAIDKASPTFVYQAKYLVTKACFLGSTTNGAGRNIVEAAIYECERTGPLAKDGKVTNGDADVCKLTKRVGITDYNLY